MIRIGIVLLVPAVLFAACGTKENGEGGGAAGGIPARLGEAYDRGLDFLRAAGSEGHYGDPGITAIAASAFLSRPGGVRPGDREFVDGLLAHVLGFQKENGGIYSEGLANYTSCAAVMALKAADRPEYADAVRKAVDFIMTLQTAEGGIGYSDKTPGWADLSNTQYALESLRAAGVPADAPVFSKALQFLQRVQNRSESNNVDYKLEDGRIVVSLDDGGGFYSPTESKADMVEVGDGKWAFRSYGSMTYALLKCYLLAGLPKNDPRVRDAVKWIGNHYTLSENPGFDTAKTPDAGQQGLYYYYLTMARALTLLGEAKVKDADGIEHDWKAEMRDRLRAMQRKDGSWANPKDRWMEGHPVLATSFALGAFSCCI
ncbi:MAG: terpene cyclase/mutase family protein [Planctomycetes bacterium]|jgi:squalene-hopene/tetraprenyl-beta-curcumene cyclase|nr:terpene cyclase/mutase family protein [Planctomycetota bacterium]